jgi:hypothetical protein
MVLMTSTSMPATTQNRGIVVRRFAGHASHADHFDAPLRVVHLTDQHVGAVTSIQRGSGIAIPLSGHPHMGSKPEISQRPSTRSILTRTLDLACSGACFPTAVVWST